MKGPATEGCPLCVGGTLPWEGLRELLTDLNPPWAGASPTHSQLRLHTSPKPHSGPTYEKGKHKQYGALGDP